MKNKEEQKTFYDRFVKKTSFKKNREAHTEDENKAKRIVREFSKLRGNGKNEITQNKQKEPKVKTEVTDKSIFSPLNEDTLAVLNSFDEIVRNALGLSLKQEAMVPKDIRILFHELTDERGSRKINYLNNPVKLTAYIYHYMWWNLVRISKLISNMQFDLNDGSTIADFGCGPLTIMCAFWIAKPELRNKKLHWYCVDISSKALSVGEAVFNSLCAFTECNTQRSWKLTKVVGNFGVTIKSKIDFFISANMFNEIFWDSSLKISGEADRAVKNIIYYLKQYRNDFGNVANSAQVLMIEPGIPLAGEFISEVRRLFLKNNFFIVLPCPHNYICPISGTKENIFIKQSRKNVIAIAHGKWCHFSFNTDDAPQKLITLSEEARLEKTRAGLSFIYCKSALNERMYEKKDNSFAVRITSDIIKLQDGLIGRYACSEKGFLLLAEKKSSHAKLKTYKSGTLVKIPDGKVNPFLKDKKTGALIINI